MIKNEGKFKNSSLFLFNCLYSLFNILFMKENIIFDKSYAFALRTINLYKFLQKEKEFILSKQLLRSGTAIGALISESEFAESRADFIHKMHIALKEANETRYWISLLKDSEYISEKMFTSLSSDITEIIALLVTIINKLKAGLNEKIKGKK